MDSKLIRVSIDDYEILRTLAYKNNSKLKYVINNILNGTIDPKTGKTI